MNKPKMVEIIKLQPEDIGKGVVSYHYSVREDGKVGEQAIWQGSPSVLIGFSKKPVTGKIEIMMKEFWRDPQQVVGMYPVFKDLNEKWYVEKIAIKEVIDTKEDMTEEEKVKARLDHLRQDPPPVSNNIIK